MDDTVLTALLCAAVAALSGAVLYQRIVLQAQMRQSLEAMTAVSRNRISSKVSIYTNPGKPCWARAS